MSVGVCYLSSRKVIKVTPTMKLQAVMEEACEHFKLDVSCCRMKKGKADVDLSLPYRFSNLPNNTTLDLEVFTKKQVGTGSKLATSRIALSVNGKSMQGTFPVTHSLTDIIAHFVSEGSFPNILSNPETSCPEVIYLQSRIGFEDFSKTTLSGLGLAGSSARLQLRYRDNTAPVAASTEPQAKGDTTITTVFASSSSSSSSAGAVPPPAVAAYTGPSPMAALKAMLENNFDAVNKPAVVVLSKYLFNAHAYPEEEKYRKLYADNKAFQEKVSAAQGAMEFLASAGFISAQSGGRDALLLPLFPATDGDGDGARQFSAACRALEQALAELDVPLEERPVLRSPQEVQKLQASLQASGSAGSEGVSAPAVFDPFKTFVRRVADVAPNGAATLTGAGTGAGGVSRKSATEERLEALEKRRRELEGDVHSVARESRLFVHSAAGASADGKAFSDARMEVEEEGDGRGDTRLMAQSLKGKLGTDDVPLTTAASRAVQRAQSETVFAKTAIKIRFPDKTVLSGVFHPRHCVRDVYEWVMGSLHTDLAGVWSDVQRQHASSSSGSCSRGGKKRAAAGVSDYPFELYTAPPRRVLALSAANGGVVNAWGDELEPAHHDSLVSRKLVPAALIMVSWTDPAVEAWVNQCNVSVDVFLPALAATAADGAAASASALFPQGVALVQRPPGTGKGDDSDALWGAGGAKQDGKGAAGDSEPKAAGGKAKKPSWFKL